MKKRLNVCVIAAVMLAAAPAAAEFKAYFGNLHAHTGVSDGKGTPQDAYSWARDQGKLDFFALTDHEEQIMQNVFDKEWDEIKNAAEANFVEGKYITLYGYEWGSPANGHINFFMQDHKYTDLLIYLLPISNLWNEIHDTPAVLMQFNHPKANAPNWNDFEHDAVVDKYARLMEVKVPASAADGEECHEKAFIRALDRGWHIAPVCNQDNHGADWGSKNECRAGVWTDDFSRAGILAALQAGRAFSSTDKDLSVSFACDGVWMGDRTPATTMNCVVIADDPDSGDTISAIEIFSRGGQLMWNILSPQKGKAQSFTLTPDKDTHNYFYVRVTLGNGKMAWTAPIYYEEGAPMPDGGHPDSGHDGGGHKDGGGDAAPPDSGEQDAGSDDGAVPDDAGLQDGGGGTNADGSTMPDAGQGGADGGLEDGAVPAADGGLESVVAGCSCSLLGIR